MRIHFMKRKANKEKCDGIDCAWCVAVNCPKEGDCNMEPKNPIIIDGVDVSVCEAYKPYLGKDDCIALGNKSSSTCKGSPNCLFKQLARKEQECKRLKDELSTYGATGICETCTDKSVLQNDKYARTLRELKEIAERQVPYINLDQVKTCMEVEFNYAGAVGYLQQRMYDILQKIAECGV